MKVLRTSDILKLKSIKIKQIERKPYSAKRHFLQRAPLLSSEFFVLFFTFRNFWAAAASTSYLQVVSQPLGMSVTEKGKEGKKVEREREQDYKIG